MQLLFLVVFEIAQYAIFESIAKRNQFSAWWTGLVSEAKEEYYTIKE
jgi:hypothetical protein